MRKLLLVLAVFCCAFQLLAWKTLRIENDPKTKGLDFQLEYPAYWSCSFTGNAVVKFKNSIPSLFVHVYVKKYETACETAYIDITGLAENVKNSLGIQGNLSSSYWQKLNGKKIFVFEFCPYKYSDQYNKLRMYLYYFDEYLVYLMVYGIGKTENEAIKNLDNNVGLCDIIAGSLTGFRKQENVVKQEQKNTKLITYQSSPRKKTSISDKIAGTILLTTLCFLISVGVREGTRIYKKKKNSSKASTTPCPKCSARKPEPVQENLAPAAPGNISITCPKCQTGYEVSGDLTGCRVECFECHCKFYAYPDYLLDENRARVQKVPKIHWEQGVLLNGEAIGGTEPPTVAAPAYKPEAPPAVPMERQFEEAFTRTMNDTGIFAAAEPGRTEKQEPESKQPAPVAKGKSIRFKTRTDFFAYALFGGNLLFDILTYRGNPLYMVAYILPSTIVFLCLVGGPWAIYNLGKVENRKIRCIIANLIFCVAVLWLWAKVSVYLGR